MKKYNNILYLVDDYIYLYHKKIYKYELAKDTLMNGKVANIKQFIEQFKELLNKSKINNSFLGAKITVIINPKYTKADISVLKNLLENLGYKKINFINEIRLYKLNNNIAFINYNNNYIIVSYIDKYRQKKCYLLDSDILSYKEIIMWISNRVINKDIYLIGLNNNITNLVEDISSNNCYYYKNKETYLIDCLINKSLQCK